MARRAVRRVGLYEVKTVCAIFVVIFLIELILNFNMKNGYNNKIKLEKKKIKSSFLEPFQLLLLSNQH
jgi:hypothetical protein